MNTQVSMTVNDREELIYLLTEAAQFEHVVMCTYLYAQWSLKKEEADGITPQEKQAIDRWRGMIRSVALEEMLHLTLVNNLLAAFGAAPHFSRPDFPIRQGYFPSDLDFHLAPFNEETMQHFVFIERPEGIEVRDGAGFTHESHYERVVCTDLLTPTARDYGSQGHLYHGIAQAIRRLAGQLGEENLFIGHGEAQLGSAEFPLPGLFKVRNVDTALKAIEEIVSQGEGAPAHREDSHFARFDAIRREHHALKQARPEFEAAHPAAVNPVLTELADDRHATRVTNSLARHVVDLGNAVYGLMLQTLEQVCAPVPLPAGLRQGLSEVSSRLMRYLTVIGEAAVKLPICPDKRGVNAGLSFALPRSFGQYVQANAAQILAERASELAAAGQKIEHSQPLPGVTDGLSELAERLAVLHREYEEHFSLVSTPEPAPDAPEPEPDLADDVPEGEADNIARSDEIEIRFDVDRCIHSRRCVLNAPTVFLANVEGPWLHPETDSAEHLVHVAQSCPSGAITYTRLDGGQEEQNPAVNTIHLRQNGPYAFHATLLIDGQPPLHRATLCRCGQSKNKPFCDNSHITAVFEATGEPEATPSEPLEERGGNVHVTPVPDGPLNVRGPVEICCGSGRTVNRTEQARLCRCGGSSNKPYCDGTHVRIGFKT
jgi:CDGSH-type Zn-finger protein/uncharacterized Fe-S cluster protein YjdI